MKYLLLLPLYFTFSFSNAQTPPVKDVIQRMLNASAALHSCKFTMKSEERMKNGKFVLNEMMVKLDYKPRKLYLYSIKPNAGTQILWREGWEDNKLVVSPGSFPFVNFTMKMNSSIARKDSHHTVADIGFDYISGLVRNYLTTYGDKFYGYASITDTTQWDNHSCIVLSVEFNDFSFFNYTVKKGETLTDIATKYHVNDYYLMMINPSVDDYDDVEEGQVIKISNFYNRKFVFYIDRLTWLPLKQIISDDKGVYESYEMKSFIPNPVFAPDEFTPEYKPYKF